MLEKEEYFLVHGSVLIDGVEVKIQHIDAQDKEVHFKTLQEAQDFIDALKKKKMVLFFFFVFFFFFFMVCRGMGKFIGGCIFFNN